MIKIVAGRRTREWFTMGKILLVLMIPFAILGAVQVVACKHNFPDKTLVDCIKPNWSRK